MAMSNDWSLERFEYDCDGLCSPSGCAGHEGIIGYLNIGGATLELLDTPEDVKEWESAARLAIQAPELLRQNKAMREALEEVKPFVSVYYDRLASLIANLYDKNPGSFSLEEARFFKYLEESRRFQNLVEQALADTDDND